MNLKKIATENDDDDEMVGRNIHREMDEMINGEDISCFFIYLNLNSNYVFLCLENQEKLEAESFKRFLDSNVAKK